MAKKSVDAAAAKAKKQKIILAVGAVLLLGVAALQGHKLMSHGSSTAAPASDTSTAAPGTPATTAPAGTAAAVTPVAVAASAVEPEVPPVVPLCDPERSVDVLEASEAPGVSVVPTRCTNGSLTSKSVNEASWLGATLTTVAFGSATPATITEPLGAVAVPPTTTGVSAAPVPLDEALASGAGVVPPCLSSFGP